MNVASLMMLVAVAAPALVSAGTIKCDTRLNMAIEGAKLLDEIDSPDRHWCMKECMKKDGCEAYTIDMALERDERVCYLWKLTKNSYLVDVEDSDVDMWSWVSCDAVKCDETETKTEFLGGKTIKTIRNTKDAFWCEKECMKKDGCNAYVFKTTSGLCLLQHIAPGQVMRKTPAAKFTSRLFCDGYSVLPVCDDGEELVNGKCRTVQTPPPPPPPPCGGKYQECCEGKCDGRLACDLNGHAGRGQCIPCGGDKRNPFQIACPGPKPCNQDIRRVLRKHDGQCEPCGGEWQPVCGSSPKCKTINGMMLMPDMRGEKCVQTLD